MKLVSWNINGIRSAVKTGFLDILSAENADIFALQEVKGSEQDASISMDVMAMGYEIFWNAAHKKGYSGTAIFSKIKPLKVTYGLWMEQHDTEWRMITLEFETFFFVTVYTPNAQRELTRLAYRQEWDKEFLAYVLALEAKKPVIFCGDLNVAHQEIDLANPAANKWNAGFTPEERSGFEEMLKKGFVDSYRFLYPNQTEAYTWWSNFNHCRERNIGWRIDYFLVSQSFVSHIEDAKIRPELFGSDHCPVELYIKNL